MSVDINMLPWRAIQRERQRRRFLVVLGLAALLGAGMGGGLSWSCQQHLDTQRQRNHYIQEKIHQLEVEGKAVSAFRALHDELQAQLGLMHELQLSRSQAAHVFSGLAKELEEGVHYTHLVREEGRLYLSGWAETNRQVSDQLRAIAAVDVFDIPVLSEVQADGEGLGRRFEIVIEERLPGQIDGQVNGLVKESSHDQERSF